MRGRLGWPNGCVAFQEENNVPETGGKHAGNARGEGEDQLRLQQPDQEGDHHVNAEDESQCVQVFGIPFIQKCSLISGRAMMMTACDLSAITKPWEIQSKVPSCPQTSHLIGTLPLP